MEKVLNEPDPDREHLSKKDVLDFSRSETGVFQEQFQKLIKGMKV
jgi:hypothetical protein